MQLRWITIGVVCFSAALLSACGNASGDLSARSASAAMSKSNGRYDSSDKDKNKSDNDDCDEADESDNSSSKSSSLERSSSKSKDDDSDECKSDDDHDKSSGHSYSKSMRVDSKSSGKDDGKDHDKKDDDDTCKVTICHIPAAENCKPHKIRVGKSEVEGHIEHGDYPGACDPVVPPPPPPPPPPTQCVADTFACTSNAECCSGTCGLDLTTGAVVCGAFG